MKKFFTVIPLQIKGQLAVYHYAAVGNTKLEMEGKISFPILTAINGYAEAGEDIRVIAVATDVEATLENRKVFEAQVKELCTKKQIHLPNGVEYLLVPDDERVSNHAATFQKLIDYADDEDELFACITYGTKPLSMSLLMAVQYAYRIKQNTSISCIVYGAVDRSAPNRENWTGRVYDMTALIQMDELVCLLAERKVPNPKRVIDQMLSL